MARKLPPPGRGRKPGSKNKRSINFRRILDSKLGDGELVDLLLGIARGTKRKVLNGRGKIVTIQDPPDGATARYLADRKWGRVPQPISGDDSGPPVAVRVVSDNRLGVKP